MEKNGSNLYFVSFPFSVVVGFFIVFLFIWFSFKTIQLQCFNNSNWIWIFTYLAIILLIVGFFYVFFIPQSLLAFWTIYSGKQLGIYYIFIYSYAYWITH